MAKIETVDGIWFFDGKYRFLSNFYPAVIYYQGIVFPTVEHAYQASKTNDRQTRIDISILKTPGAAKRRGRSLTLHKDWEDVKLHVMYSLVFQKFMMHEDLKGMLLKTGKKYIEEGNTWGDRYWGVHNGMGANHLGQIIMTVRSILMLKEKQHA